MNWVRQQQSACQCVALRAVTVTNSMQQSPPWEANSHSASQITRLLWKPKVHYRIHNSKLLVYTVRETHPVHNFSPYFPNITDWLTDPMQQNSSWEADSHSANQEIPGIIRSPTVHYRVHNSPPLVPMLCQMNPIHNFPLYFPNIHSDIICISCRIFSKPYKFTALVSWNIC
jgi:hypothetical protein